jgi:glycosyl transferase family 25
MSHWTDYISKIIFINLDYRVDRLDQITEELEKLSVPLSKIERFSAIKESPGFIGCTRSHLAVLKLAREKNYQNVLILEDDFLLHVSPEVFNQKMTQFFQSGVEYDVVMPAYNVLKSEPYNDLIAYAREVQTASAYIVNQRFYDKLINCMEEGLNLLVQTHCHWLYMNDQYWKKLQTNSEWFYFKERLSIQREGWSDLGETYVDYQC